MELQQVPTEAQPLFGSSKPTTTSFDSIQGRSASAVLSTDRLHHREDDNVSPLVARCRHTLQPNGSIVGTQVADAILPVFPTLVSAIPIGLCSSSNSSKPAVAVASIDGRTPINHERVHDFIVNVIGPALHSLSIGRGDRVAVLLPNGPELALAILAVSNWATCVPLNASGAKSELAADLRACGADLVFGPFCGPENGDVPLASPSFWSSCSTYQAAAKLYHVLPSGSSSNDDFKAFGHVQEIAADLGIPFAGVIKSKTESGIFHLVRPNGTPLDNLDHALSVKNTSSISLASVAASVTSKLSSNYHQGTVEATETSSLLGLPDSPEGNSIATTKKVYYDDHLTETSSSTSSDPPTPPRALSTVNLSEIRSHSKFAMNQHSDEVLVLFTSGTTGNKKIVPHRLGDMLVASATIALSWNLTPNHVNCNLMPLFHVGGIVRQVFSPVLSGGSVICCPSFDPTVFWALLKNKAFTWYYAAPTMHHMILQTGKETINGKTQIELINPQLHMIANAAGGLLPSLAVELRAVFKANVLPSYGMTECMPISSPPSTYQLEKPGTSGVPVGPQVAILNLDTMEQFPPGTEGAICVRGTPCFLGYGVPSDAPAGAAAAPESFLEGGWFNTGDLGYLDQDGYLYITGRAKEVINRGGEIISPMEVEEAVMSHPSVRACAAFSAPHDVLQEVVGIVIVFEPNATRFGLPALHKYLGQDRLAAPKWPQCLVIMDELPKSHTNKLLRVKLGERLGLPELSDDMHPIERTFTAICPLKGASLEEPIPSMPVTVDSKYVQLKLKQALCVNNDQELHVVPHATRPGTVVAYVHGLDLMTVVQIAMERLDVFEVPSHVCLLNEPGVQPERFPAPKPTDSLESIVQQVSPKGPFDPLVAGVQDLIATLLKLEYIPSPDASFFHLGGGSMLASQLASKIRKLHDVPFGGAEVFQHPSAVMIATLVRSRSQPAQNKGPGEERRQVEVSDSSTAAKIFHDPSSNVHGVPFGSDRLLPELTWWKGLIQLIPLCIVLPTFQLARFFFYFMLLLSFLKGADLAHSNLSSLSFDFYLLALVMTLLLYHIIWVTVTPLLFVAIKWLVIGRYRAGRYPLWSNYYLRWWFVDVCRKLIGRGVFGSHDFLLNFYYRLLGADIRKGACISLEAEVAEYDLVTVGEGAAVEFATLRAFGVDNGAMILGPVSVGTDSSVGCRSVVAPFTSIPDGHHLGPGVASYDVGKSSSSKHARYHREKLPHPSTMTLMLIGAPITFFIDLMSRVPSFLVLYWMIKMPYHYNIGVHGTMSDLMDWLCDVRRIPFYIGIRAARTLLAPFIRMGLSILVKRFIIGKFQPGPRDTLSEWQLLRHWLSASLFTREKIQDVADIVGRHYELVSVLYRLIGAKIGKRVFWPGHQPVFSGEFDLLEIGDDVVFGSRSVIFCTTADSYEKVILCAGSNLSDNSIILPGGVLGKNSVLGSNSICPAGWYLPEGSVWVGNQDGEPVLLEKGVEGDFEAPILADKAILSGKVQLTGDETTIRPFGKAFYQGQAKYNVFPLSFIIPYTIYCKLLAVSVHTIPLLGALHGAACILYGSPFETRDYHGTKFSTPIVFVTVLSVFFFTNILRLFVWLSIEMTAKWTIMGRRRPGQYNYDECDYAQRWELYQIQGKIRSIGRVNLMNFLTGTPFITAYSRMQGAKIGKDCCLYPTGSDPFMPEPDLVEMGDRCVIDKASVVCHLNTGGNFNLEKIYMEDNVTLRTRSRIQQGVVVEKGSMLLEKSLALTGEVLDEYSCWKGAPATRVFGYSRPNSYQNV